MQKDTEEYKGCLNPNSTLARDIPSSLCQPNKDSSYDLSVAVKNSKYTRLIWTTHNDFHKHKFWEICIMLKGSGKHYFVDHVEEMVPGAVWLLRPSDIHRIQPIGSTQNDKTSSYAHRDIYVKEEKLKRLLDALDPSLYENLLNAKAPLFGMIPLASLKSLESTINYYSLNDENFEFMHTVIVSHVLSLIIEQKNYLRHDMPEWINKLITDLNNEDFMTQRMEQIISSVGYTQSYICRQFKKYIGTTLSKYIQQTKCLYSLSLLTDGNTPIAEIAYRLSFPDESNYINTFKQIYKTTPGQWRKRLKQSKQEKSIL